MSESTSPSMSGTYPRGIGSGWGRGLTGLVLAGLVLATPLSAAMSRGFQNLLNAVVRIDVRDVDYSAGVKRFSAGVGSGVIIDQSGLILTNAHVASPFAVEMEVTLANLERVPATLVGWDHWTDLALIQLDMAQIEARQLKFTTAKFGDSTQLFPGQTVFAVGTPHGLTRTVTRGIVSNTQRYFQSSSGVQGHETGMFNNWLQTDAAINPGNSGGPLVTEKGEIIGINSRGYLGADNLAFAIPSATAREVVAGLRGGQQITRSYLGIVPGALRDLEKFYDLAANRGLLVNSVDPGSPAQTAGLRAGDIVLSIDGRPVDGRFPEQLPPIQHRLAAFPVGTTVHLTVKRGTETKELAAVVELLESRVGTEWALEAWGLGVQKVTRTFARENQLPSADGFLVIGMQPGFPAAKAQLKVGDIITTINQQPVNTLDELKALAQAYEHDPQPALVEARRRHQVSLYVLKP